MDNQIIKVSAHSSASASAGAIAALIREKGARGYLAPEGIEIVIVPSFASTTINGDERTAIRLEIQTR